MEKKDLDHFKAKLEQISSEILSEAEKTILEMTDHSDNYPDPTDRASAESDRSFELRIRDRERKLLNKIKEAIERIDNGTYGVCDDCGDDIAHERLDARPVTTYCIDCKTRQEHEEKNRS
ncbi:MAG: RNA polymerase-binding protein DksA [Proteobacteria bacterium]|nr:RNA polymerase-binding protein DksA [Pseudomonadota bacterium]MBU1688375.1 RNA polymerase-binding protein DksA [Pseudomonadota bacterium]